MVSDYFFAKFQEKRNKKNDCYSHLILTGKTVTILQSQTDDDTLNCVFCDFSFFLKKETFCFSGTRYSFFFFLITHSESETHMLIPSKGQRAQNVHRSKRQSVLKNTKKFLLIVYAVTG